MTFRSIQMSHFRMFLPRQSYYNAMEQLLNLGNSHFIDIGSPLSRPFFTQVRRIQQLLQKISTLSQTVKQQGLQIQQFDQMQDSYMNDLHNLWKGQSQIKGVQRSKLLDFFEEEISQNWNRFIQKKQSIQKLKNNRNNSLSKIACIQAVSNFFGDGKQAFNSKGISAIVGVIDPALQLKLSKTVYRVSRGFAFFKGIDEFKYPALSSFNMRVIILIYPTSSSGILQKKLMKIMQNFCSTMMHVNDQSSSARQSQLFIRQFQQMSNLLQLNTDQMKKLLKQLTSKHSIESWRTFLWKQKLVYQTLNKMQLRENFLVAELYLPKVQKDRLNLRIHSISPAPELQEIQLGKAPTAFDTNCYTAIPQQITDTYGIPRYQEINPAIFTTVTFPFFFGVMFGDIGHGLVLFALGIYLVFNDEAIKKSSMAFASKLRYMVLMMGFFAFYCGWIYNDFLGANVNIFGSCYTPRQVKEDTPILPDDADCIYPIGIDPVWGVASNELVYVNALKMKISVIIAIIHMAVGVVVKCFNALYFKRKLQVFFQFIPQFLFLVLLFGYMDFLIIFKWLTPWTSSPIVPSIISTMMDIGLQVGSTEKAGAMWGVAGQSSQDTIQVIILLIAVICVPIMLLPKPIIEIKRHKKQKKDYPLLHQQLQNQRQNVAKSGVPHEEHDAGQIFVHQLIETIQFVLGAISNTASYLRLWALSLAHSQLAKVFFAKTLQSGFVQESEFMSIIMMPIFFYVLVWVTFGVLMCMDTMQCFLHALRLHWVQFQNKFYKGDGYAYAPSSSKAYIIEMKQAL